jgi:hypothetical protein
MSSAYIAKIDFCGRRSESDNDGSNDNNKHNISSEKLRHLRYFKFSLSYHGASKTLIQLMTLVGTD